MNGKEKEPGKSGRKKKHIEEQLVVRGDAFEGSGGALYEYHKTSRDRSEASA